MYKPYKSKRKPRQVERRPIFKEPLPVVEILGKMVDQGKITEECASEALCVNSNETFQAFCAKWINPTKIGRSSFNVQN